MKALIKYASQMQQGGVIMKRIRFILFLILIIVLSACSGRALTQINDIDGTDIDNEKTTEKDNAQYAETTTSEGTSKADGNADKEVATSKEEKTDTEATASQDTMVNTNAVAVSDEITGIPVYETDDPADGFSKGIWIKKYPGNNACFKLETPQKYQIICDPYDINEALQPDIVTESHQDSDHTDTESLTLPYELITEPGEYSYDEVLIKGYAGNHNKGSYSGINTIFVFTFDDITIAHFASQGALPEDEVLEQIGPVDVLMVQFFVNPNYNKLTAADVEKIVEKLNPKIIIPEHCDASSAGWLATRMKLTEEIVTSGSLLVTRDLLDSSDNIRIICLEQE